MKPALNGATSMKYPLELEITAAAKAGFEGLELWWDKVVTFLLNNSINDLHELLQENNIKAVGICPFAFSPYRDIDECRRDIQQGLEIAAAIECDTLTVCGYGRPVQISKEEASHRFADELAYLSEMAEKYQVKLAIEPVSGNTIFQNPLDTLKIIELAGNPENLGTLVDTFHYSRVGMDPGIVCSIPVDKMYIVHINDSIEGEGENLTDADRLYPTEGVLDLAGYMKMLKKIEYQGYLSVEVFRRDYWKEDIDTICTRAKAGYDAMIKL